MIKVEKDFANAPAILKSDSRRLAFDENIARGEYCDEKNRYKSDLIIKELNKNYHTKCAYCEKSLLDAPKHIEHYRPKRIYYWLAYSWDNLLLACGGCNSAKGDRFEVENARVLYRDEAFENIHTLGKEYDKLEKPLIVNPEADDLAHLLAYDKDAVADSSDKRVKHTIEVACKLNREELVQLRRVVVEDFINQVNECYLIFKANRDLSTFKPIVVSFLDKCSIESEFYTFKCFVVKNIEIFFENSVIRVILKHFINERSKL